MAEAPVVIEPQHLARVVPSCLRARRQWVCWRYVERDGRVTKCPICPTKGGLASATDPATWGSFEQACAALVRCPDLAGVGFVFTADDPYAGVDLDNCVDPTTNKPKPWAQSFIDQLDSYAEISPSGRGVKIIVRAAKPGPRCKRGYEDGAVELYDAGRFFTVTGQRVTDASGDVEDRQAELNALYERLFGSTVAQAAAPAADAQASDNGRVVLADEAILRLAQGNRRSGGKFTDLWAGRWNSHFNSRSEADSSLVFTLAFYTKDAAQIDRLYRRCGLMREKWDERHGRQTYGEMTIAKALQTVTGQYRPRRRRAGTNRFTPDTPPANSSQPQIQGNERQLRDIRADALRALRAANDPPRLFRHGDGVARIELARNDRDASTPHIQLLEAHALRGEMTDAADWFTLKHDRQGDRLEPDLPPLSVARDILALPALELPPLLGLINCPAFTGDGHLVVADGYDAESGLWHHRTVADLPVVPERPTSQDVEAARDMLVDIIAEFPFADASSLANAVALMLLPFVRYMIDGPTPLHAVDAPTAGTGKSLLLQACLWPGLGHGLDIRTGAREPDEWRKRITSELAAGKPAIGFDNATSRLDSEHLAAVLTATAWTDRVLGQTRIVTLPNRAMWVCTGNNLAFSKEITRRVVWIRLDAHIESPENRAGFRYPNLIAAVRERRASLVHAGLTLVRAWLAASRPRGARTMGSFEDYAAMLGGILVVAGVPGFLGNADQLRQRADNETGEWRAFVHVWWEKWQSAWVGVSELATLLWESEGRRSDLLIGVVTSGRERGALTQLGMRLSRKRDCVIGDLRIVVDDRGDRCGRLQYRLINAENDDGLQTSCRPSEKVCTKVCTDNYHDDNSLDQSCRPCIPFNLPPGACIGARTRACEIAPRPGKRSARSAVDAQVADMKELNVADLAADLEQTSFTPLGRSAAPTVSDAAWYGGPINGLPDRVIELARRRDGWSPSAWRDRLLQLAERCRETDSATAAMYRQAARLICPEGGAS
ncbi:MAG: hypothetical protein J5J06_18070 [Phycisphaerae bacterium]|nr:hypothetical protein [Phycisphaerae bacterium]